MSRFSIGEKVRIISEICADGASKLSESSIDIGDEGVVTHLQDCASGYNTGVYIGSQKLSLCFKEEELEVMR